MEDQLLEEDRPLAVRLPEAALVEDPLVLPLEVGLRAGVAWRLALLAE